MQQPSVPSLVERSPSMTAAEIADSLVPPRQFESATLENYEPDPDYPSQARAVERVRAFAGLLDRVARPLRRSARPRPSRASTSTAGSASARPTCSPRSGSSRPAAPTSAPSSSSPRSSARSATPPTVKLLSGASFIAIDEFELDDPGDTMMMTRLLGELASGGTRIAATSNTPPNALGEGRFAAVDFLREIQALSDRFEIVRIDGLDYRHRDVESHAVDARRRRVCDRAWPRPAANGSRHRGPVRRHPEAPRRPCIRPATSSSSTGSPRSGSRTSRVLHDQTDALRFVALVDRLYDAQVRVLATGVPARRGVRRRHARRRLPQEVPARDLATDRAHVA